MCNFENYKLKHLILNSFQLNTEVHINSKFHTSEKNKLRHKGDRDEV